MSALALLVLTVASISAQAGGVQLCIPDAGNSAYSSILPKALRYDGATVGMGLVYDPNNFLKGTPISSDQIKIDNFKKAATDFLSRGKRLTVRMNGIPFMGINAPSPWQVMAGTAADSIYYPQPGPSNIVWKTIGQVHKKYADILANICDSLHVDRGMVTLELSNEVDIGGITGPYRAKWSDVKPTILQAYDLYNQCLASPGSSACSTWQSTWLQAMPSWTVVNGAPLPMGSVPIRYFDQMLAQMEGWGPDLGPGTDSAPKTYGFHVVASTLESSGGVVNGAANGDFVYELRSWDNDKARSYVAKTGEIHVNHYAPYYKGRTAAEVAQAFKDGALAKKTLLANHPTFIGVPFGTTESSISISNSPGLSQVSAYRQAIVDIIPSMGVTESSIFIALEQNGADSGFGLYTYSSGVLTPIDGPGGVDVYPTSSGSGNSDTTAPTVSITSPGAGATVSGTITVGVAASDNVGVSSIALLVDGSTTGTVNSLSAISLNTSLLLNGTHTLIATAKDAAGNVGQSASVQINVSNSTTTTTSGSSLSIVSPANGSKVKAGSRVNIIVNATQVYKVAIYIDGNLKFSASGNPQSVSWNWSVPGAVGKTHTIDCKGYNSSGSQVTSATSKVTTN